MSLFEKFVATVTRLVKGDLTKATVDKALADAAKKNPEDLDYRNSITDLFKLLKLESTEDGRADMADELGYDGPELGSAEGNTALHTLVMKKLAERYVPLPKD